jgi:hypothetical protein
MKKLAMFALVLTLLGCGTTPPRPPECAGPLVPINSPADQQ